MANLIWTKPTKHISSVFFCHHYIQSLPCCRAFTNPSAITYWCLDIEWNGLGIYWTDGLHGNQTDSKYNLYCEIYLFYAISNKELKPFWDQTNRQVHLFHHWRMAANCRLYFKQNFNSWTQIKLFLPQVWAHTLQMTVCHFLTVWQLSMSIPCILVFSQL